MMLLQLKSITKYIGSRKILENISFIINKKQRVGIMGLNGSGKSTLFNLISGKEKADSGEIITPGNIRTGYLPQGFNDICQGNKTIKDFLYEPLEKYISRLSELENIMSLKTGDLDEILSEYEKVREIFEQSGGYFYGEKLKKIFKVLTIDENIFPESPALFNNLSGGEKLKLGLVRILAGEPDLLLLDEPTNYLDISSLLWLEDFLVNFNGGLLVISHDRKFLDKVATEIMELSILNGRIKSYNGNYSFYRIQKEKELEKHWQEYNEQQDKIRMIREDISQTKGYALKTELSTIHFFPRAKARKVARKAVVRQKKLEKLLSEEKRIDKPWNLETVRIKIDTDAKKGKSLISVKNLGFNLPDGRNLFDGLSLDLSCGEKIAIMGPNGSGKSTLIKIIAGKIKDFFGEVIVWPETFIGYLPQNDFDCLDLEKTVIEEFRSDMTIEEGECRTYLHKMLFKGEDVFKKIANLSYGERIKLIILKLMASGVNALLLDEPTSHLDIDSMERLEKALEEYTGGMLVITHDRYFIEKLNIRKIYVMEKNKFILREK